MPYDDEHWRELIASIIRHIGWERFADLASYDVIVTFDDFFAAMQFGYDVALADGVVKKLITPMIWPIPQHFNALKAHCPEGRHVIFAMIAEPSLESFKAILGARGTITYQEPHDDSPGKEPLQRS